MILDGVKLIALDLYGTLINKPSKNGPYEILMEKLCLSPNQRRLAKNILLKHEIYDLEEIAGQINFCNLPLPDLNFFTKLLTEELENIHIFDDTTKFLEHSSEQYSLCLISNLATHYKVPYFNLGLDKYFKSTIFSCEVGFVKPEEEIFNLIIDSSEVSLDSILMIGDSLSSDYEGAAKVGIKSLLLNRDSQGAFENSKISSLLELLDPSLARG